MKYKLLNDTGKPYGWCQPLGKIIEAPDPETAMKRFTEYAVWLRSELEADPTRIKNYRVEPVDQAMVSLGAQLWEPCERCGAEPSYMQPGGHLCRKCAQSDHPKIDLRVPYDSEEPSEGKQT